MSLVVQFIGGPLDGTVRCIERFPFAVMRPVIWPPDDPFAAIRYETGTYTEGAGGIALWHGWTATDEVPTRAGGWKADPPYRAVAVKNTP